MRKLFLLKLTTTVVLFACTREIPPPLSNPDTPPNPTDTTIVTNPQNPTDTTIVINPPEPDDTSNPIISPSVYIAGDSFDLSTRYLPYPVYWKNGKQVHLPNAAYSSGTGIAVDGTNVYVSGSGNYLGSNVTYWKNGTGINLADPTILNPTSTNITFAGGDVYTLGNGYVNGLENYVPVYWKNQDNTITIKTISGYDGNGRAIVVSGADVYIAGSTDNTTPGHYTSPPCYWKNGTPTFLYSITPSSENGLAKSIYVSGADIHVVGEVYPIGSASAIGWAVYWKNGTAKELTSSTQVSRANCVTVVGSDVYIAGAITGEDRLLHAAYWKNGKPVTLDAKYSVANAITVYGSDIYVAGNRGVDTALYWKNGLPIILGRGRANAIAVVK
jgi:hypothetical protein